jgi:hypothetical protein
MNAFTRTLILTLLATALAPAARADSAVMGPHYPDVVSLERGIEASTDTVLLPTSVPGSLTVNRCPGCRSQALAVTTDTTFYVGSVKVPLSDFRARVAAAPSTFLMVFASVKDAVALRVVLHAAPTVTPKTR